jgi:hypothetical protein
MSKQILKINSKNTNTYFNNFNFPKVIDELICKFYNDNDYTCLTPDCNHKDFKENLIKCGDCEQLFCDECCPGCNGCDEFLCDDCYCECRECEGCDERSHEDDFRIVLHFDGEEAARCLECLYNHINTFTPRMSYKDIECIMWSYDYKNDNIFNKWDTDWTGKPCVNENRNLEYNSGDFSTLYDFDSRVVKQPFYKDLKCIRCNRHQHNSHKEHSLDEEDDLYFLDDCCEVEDKDDKDLNVICEYCITTIFDG